MKIRLGIEEGFIQLKSHQAQKALLCSEQPKSEMEHNYQRTLNRIQYAKQYWKAEKEQRIKRLLWWAPELVSKLNLPADARVWHIHPVALMANFNKEEDYSGPTWDKVTNKRIEQLHPSIREITYKFINQVEKRLKVRLRVVQGLRTIEEQNKIYAKGRTTKGGIVTHAKGG